MRIVARNESAQEAAGARLGAVLQGGDVVFLHGPLGSGKTTFVRGLLRALGVTGTLRSPTYTLVEMYRPNVTDYIHFDLYRIEDAEELELIGARENFRGDAVCLIEWPERGQGFLPAPTVSVVFAIPDGNPEAGRTIAISGRDGLERV